MTLTQGRDICKGAGYMRWLWAELLYSWTQKHRYPSNLLVLHSKRPNRSGFYRRINWDSCLHFSNSVGVLFRAMKKWFCHVFHFPSANPLNLNIIALTHSSIFLLLFDTSPQPVILAVKISKAKSLHQMSVHEIWDHQLRMLTNYSPRTHTPDLRQTSCSGSSKVPSHLSIFLNTLTLHFCNLPTTQDREHCDCLVKQEQVDLSRLPSQNHSPHF